MKRLVCLICGMAGLGLSVHPAAGAAGAQTVKTDAPGPQAAAEGKAARYDLLRLKMISGSAGRRMATINDETFMAGESRPVTLGDQKVFVECVEIREQSALVKVDDESSPRELRLGEVKSGTFRQAVTQESESSDPAVAQNSRPASTLMGREVKFAEFNFAITLPQGWQRAAAPAGERDLQAVFTNATGTAMLLVLAENTHQPSPEINQRTIPVIEFIAKGDGRVLSKKLIRMGGITGYERVEEFDNDGRRTPVLVQIVAAGGITYGLQALCKDAAADRDPEIRRCLSSFRFITPPKNPTRSPSPADPSTVAYRVGYGIGTLFMIGVLVFVLRTVFGGDPWGERRT